MPQPSKTARAHHRVLVFGLALVASAALVLAACAGGAGAPQSADQTDIDSATARAQSANATAAAGGVAAPEPSTATFDTQDGATLSGTLYGGGDTVALLSNMRNAEQRSWQSFAEKVAGAGYAAFTFDYRGRGASEGTPNDSLVDRDVRAAITYLRGEGFTHIVLIGASMGGTASAKNTHEANVTGLGLISAPKTFESIVVSEPDLGDLPYPKVFVASMDDEPYVTDIRTLHSFASDPKEITLFTGNTHGTALLDSEHAANLEELLLDLIRQAAGD